MDSLLYVFVVLSIIVLAMLIAILLRTECCDIIRQRINRKKYENRMVNVFKALFEQEAMQEIQGLLSVRPCTDKLPPEQLEIHDYRKMQQAKEELQRNLDCYLSQMEIVAIFRASGMISTGTFEKNFEKMFVDIRENPALSLYIYRRSFDYTELNEYIKKEMLSLSCKL